MKKTDKSIIIDLEATCWQGAVPQGQQNEIIEIMNILIENHNSMDNG